MLMVILLCFSLKVADVSLSESGHLVPWWLTSHTIGEVFTLLNQEHDTKVLLVERKLAFARRVGKDFHLTEKGQMASGELEQLTDKLI
jgi:ABC-type branched-subunit amino acid transport system ATPase component